MKRGIDDSIECSENMNLAIVSTANQIYHPHYHHHHHIQNHQQLNNTASTSPLSSSSNSSSNGSSGVGSGGGGGNGSGGGGGSCNMSINSVSSINPASYSSSSASSASSSYSPISHTTQYITSNGSPFIFTLTTPATTLAPHIQQSGTFDSSSISTSVTTTHKPEAKKFKIQKAQPSKVVHIRNIPQQLSEIEVIQLGLIFGNIATVLNLRSKCQAFLEFEKCEEAQSMINYFANNPITVSGRQIFVQYSNYKTLITDPSNTNNQIAKAALNMAKDLHKAAQSGGSNTVLRAMIQNMLYTVSLETIYQVFSRYGPVLKIITFTKNDKYQALIQMKDANAAQSAKNALHGQNVYSGCCTLHIDYSKLNTLNVKYNNEKSRDYTNPLLQAGDCPDPLALSNILSTTPLQISMAAYGAPHFATPATLQPGYHQLAQGAGQFITFPAKYLTHQTLIAPTSIIPSTGQPTVHGTTIQTANGQSLNPNTSFTLNPNITANQIHQITNTTNLQPTIQQTQQQQQQQPGNNNTNGQLLIPIVQNHLNHDDGYFMMYATS